MTCSHLRPWVLPIALCPPLFVSRKTGSRTPFLDTRTKQSARGAQRTSIVTASFASTMLSGLKKVLTQVEDPSKGYLDHNEPEYVLYRSYTMRTVSLKQCTLQEGSSAGDGVLDFSDNAPSWEALERLVQQQAQELGWEQPDLEEVRKQPCMQVMHVRTSLAAHMRKAGPWLSAHAMLQGPTNPLALKRTFGQPGTPRVKLYRCRPCDQQPPTHGIENVRCSSGARRQAGYRLQGSCGLVPVLRAGVAAAGGEAHPLHPGEDQHALLRCSPTAHSPIHLLGKTWPLVACAVHCNMFVPLAAPWRHAMQRCTSAVSPA